MTHPTGGFTTVVDPEVLAYIEGLRGADDALIARLETYAAEHKFPIVGRESGYFLELLAASVGARTVFEFGSGFGYSALFFARGVGRGGVVIGTDDNSAHLDAHQRLFEGHALQARIKLNYGDAFDIFARTEGSFDVVFLDLHKSGYRDAYERALPRVRSGGLIIADNVIWGGKVTRPAVDPDTEALQQFNAAVFADPRVQPSIAPIGDGLLVARKR